MVGARVSCSSTCRRLDHLNTTAGAHNRHRSGGDHWEHSSQPASTEFVLGTCLLIVFRASHYVSSPKLLCFPKACTTIACILASQAAGSSCCFTAGCTYACMCCAVSVWCSAWSPHLCHVLSCLHEMVVVAGVVKHMLSNPAATGSSRQKHRHIIRCREPVWTAGTCLFLFHSVCWVCVLIKNTHDGEILQQHTEEPWAVASWW